MMSAPTDPVSDVSINSLPEQLKNKQFQCGDLIVKATPFVHVVSNKYKSSYCNWCALPPKGSKLLRCSACQNEYYCNQQCQKDDWKFHKFECPIISSNLPDVAADSIRLLTKVLWHLSSKVEHKPKSDPGWRKWHDLCDHSAKIQADDNRGQNYLAMLYKLFKYYDHSNLLKHGISSDSQVLMGHYGRVMFNTFTLTHMGDEIGAAIYLSPSVFNHSCSPNAAHVCDGTTLYVRALKHIDTSKEPIFVNYIDPMQAIATRQLELRQNYYFHCHCEKCEDKEHEALLESTICPTCDGDVVQQFDDTLLCKSCGKAIDDGKYRDCCETTVLQAAKLADGVLSNSDVDVGKIEQFIKTNKILSNKNVFLNSLKCILYAELSQSEDSSKQAYTVGEEITNLLKLYYPKVYPAHSIHQLKQARLAWNCEQFNNAMKHYRCAYRNLLLTHGAEHHITELVKSDMAECEPLTSYPDDF